MKYNERHIAFPTINRIGKSQSKMILSHTRFECKYENKSREEKKTVRKMKITTNRDSQRVRVRGRERSKKS